MRSDEIRPVKIVLADDDDGDVMLTKRALTKSKLRNDLDVVGNGRELLEYLAGSDPLPDLILLDLNMPVMDGREALSVIRTDSRLKNIPVVVLTTSGANGDVVFAYEMGANSFVNKPVNFDRLVSALQTLHGFWFQIVRSL